MLALDVALLSDRGGRPYNEDACGHWQSDQQLCCVLADGAGGHGGGDFASKLAVQDLLGRFAHQPSQDGAALEALLRQTNQSVLDQRVPGSVCQDMHSTTVCLVINRVSHRAHWAHVGDSRLYWFRDGRLKSRTRDHSLVQALVDAGMLDDRQLRVHPRRSELRSALGLAADVIEVSSADCGETLSGADVFMLCTDGLWEYVDDALLEATLGTSPTPRAWLDTLCAEVRERAGHKASHDNFTALAVWVDEV